VLTELLESLLLVVIKYVELELVVLELLLDGEDLELELNELNDCEEEEEVTSSELVELEELLHSSI